MGSPTERFDRAALRRVVAATWLALAGPTYAAGADETFAYTIKHGDTLVGIARAHLVEPQRWSELQKLNKVRNERRLVPGAPLHIPFAWLRQSHSVVEVVQVNGQVDAAGRAPRAGDTLREGDQIRTGKQSSIALRFPDGSAVTVQPDTTVRLERLRIFEINGAPHSTIRIEQGRVENAVPAARKVGARFEVVTPAAVAGVRGTHYRVADEQGTAYSEVLDGNVAVAQAGRPDASVEVGAGYGVRVRPGAAPEPPVALLAAPQLAQLPGLLERPIARFQVPALPGATRYRAQIAPDASFQSIRQDLIFGTSELRFTDLPDGSYVLRARGIDQLGLEGRDATHAFKLKARPEPPFPSAPAAGGKVRAETVTFAWSGAAEAASYVLQVAADRDFRKLHVDSARLTALDHVPETKFMPGEYRWRIASVRADGDRGPWSDVQTFLVLPPPATPEPPAIDAKTLSFRWPAEPGQRFLFQLARDDKFARLVKEERLDTPSIALPRPAEGTYYMRVQATDPDGFVGPFTAPQRIEVPKPPPALWPLLMLLVPLLAL